MIKMNANDTKDNFNSICDKAFNGETIFVSIYDNKNIVMISESEYNNILKAKRNADYLAMLDKSIEEANRGEFIVYSTD